MTNAIYCSWTVCTHCDKKSLMHGDCNHPDGKESLLAEQKLKITDNNFMTSCKCYTSQRR